MIANLRIAYATTAASLLVACGLAGCAAPSAPLGPVVPVGRDCDCPPDRRMETLAVHLHGGCQDCAIKDPGYYGFTPTCWRRWPSDWHGCPTTDGLTGEVIGLPPVGPQESLPAASPDPVNPMLPPDADPGASMPRGDEPGAPTDVSPSPSDSFTPPPPAVPAASPDASPEPSEPSSIDAPRPLDPERSSSRRRRPEIEPRPAAEEPTPAAEEMPVETVQRTPAQRSTGQHPTAQRPTGPRSTDQQTAAKPARATSVRSPAVAVAPSKIWPANPKPAAAASLERAIEPQPDLIWDDSKQPARTSVKASPVNHTADSRPVPSRDVPVVTNSAPSSSAASDPASSNALATDVADSMPSVPTPAAAAPVGQTAPSPDVAAPSAYAEAATELEAPANSLAQTDSISVATPAPQTAATEQAVEPPVAEPTQAPEPVPASAYGPDMPEIAAAPTPASIPATETSETSDAADTLAAPAEPNADDESAVPHQPAIATDSDYNPAPTLADQESPAPTNIEPAPSAAPSDVSTAEPQPSVELPLQFQTIELPLPAETLLSRMVSVPASPRLAARAPNLLRRNPRPEMPLRTTRRPESAQEPRPESAHETLPRLLTGGEESDNGADGIPPAGIPCAAEEEIEAALAPTKTPHSHDGANPLRSGRTTRLRPSSPTVASARQ